jgi:hypothetical protein
MPRVRRSNDWKVTRDCVRGSDPRGSRACARMQEALIEVGKVGTTFSLVFGER